MLVRGTIIAVENKCNIILSVCVCSLRRTGCRALAPHYIVVCCLSDYAHYLEEGTIFGKWYCRYNVCCDFLYNFA